MLPVTNAFRESIYAPERMILARATIHIDAFGKETPLPFLGLKSDMQGKVAGSSAENSNVYKSMSGGALVSPSNVKWQEKTNQNYANVSVVDGTTDDVINTAINERGSQLFGFNVLDILEREFGETIWQGKTTTAEKRNFAVTFLDKLTLNWHGYGRKPSIYFQPFRYIRDWVNGNTINSGNQWNEIQCLAGVTNRCAGKTPTSNKTITNPLNATNGVTTDYASEGSNTGPTYLQIDLGAVYSDINSIKIIHYYLDGRSYKNTKTEISADGVNWITLRDSAFSGTYVETSAGLTIQSTVQVPFCGLAVFENNTDYGNWGGHTFDAVTKVTKTYTDANIALNDEGFLYVCAYSEICNMSSNFSVIKTDYVELILDGSIKITTRLYDRKNHSF